ncbi:MAG TPA: hypothetical protein VF779_09065 [Pyrinomonadaceae bacterium]
MTNEEMQRTMQFLLEQQAQFTVRLQKDEERIARVENAVLLLTELARRADERMDDADKRMNNFDVSLSGANDTLNEKMARLAEVHTETVQRLDALIVMVERYLNNRNGSSQS